MKLAVCYTVFNGLELLDDSINNIFPFANELIICYQSVSNKGNFDAGVSEFMNKYRNTRIHILKYTPDLKLNTKANEIKKHNVMLNVARGLRCSHFLIMATDHFYKHYEFAAAKDVIVKSDFDSTFTAMFTYYKKPTYQLTPIEDYFCPFICKLYPYSVFQKMPSYPVRVDPALQISTLRNWYLFEQSTIMLHHYSMIRNDIKHKFANAAASMRWKPSDVYRFVSEYENFEIEKNNPISYFGGRRVKEVDNWFDV